MRTTRRQVGLLLIGLVAGSTIVPAAAQVLNCPGYPLENTPCEDVDLTVGGVTRSAPELHPEDIFLTVEVPMELQTPLVAGQEPVLTVGTASQKARTYQGAAEGFSPPVEQTVATRTFGHSTNPRNKIGQAGTQASRLAR